MKSYVEKEVIFQSQLSLSEKVYTHKRTVYGFLDLLGDIGGIADLLILMFGIFIFPYSEHSFNISAVKKLYMAQTRDVSLFKTQQVSKKFPNHRRI